VTWATARLAEIASIRHGGTPRKKVASFWGGDVPWVSPKDMGRSVLIDTVDHITADAVVHSATSIMPANSIFIVARSGVLAHSVPVALARQPMSFNQDIKAIAVDATRFEADYVFWFLRSQERRILVQGVKRGATVHSLHSGFVENLPIPLAPLDEQRRIVDILNRANGILRLRREALGKTRQLIPALFVDMFGDPATNVMGLPRAQLGEVIKVRSGTFLPAKRMAQDGEYPVYGGNGINGFHSEYLFEEPVIVIGRVGAQCGNVHLTAPRCWVTDNALYVAEQKADLDPVYLVTALRRANLNRRASQSGQPLISGGRIYPVEILIPPVERQKSFSSQVADIQATVGQQERMAEASEHLVAALMARLFDGEPAKPALAEGV